jgi:hypothetical protein
MLTLESWQVCYGSGAAPDSQDSNALYISGHQPSFKEWRSCDTESDARFLATRRDPNRGLFGVQATVPVDKSVTTAPQRIRLSEDAVLIRLRLSPISASGPGVTIQPVRGQSNSREFPHSIYKFTIRTLE